MKNKNILVWVGLGAVAYFLYKRSQDAEAVTAFQAASTPVMSNHWLPYPSMISPSGAAALRASSYNARVASDFRTMTDISAPDSFFPPDSFSLTLNQYQNA